MSQVEQRIVFSVMLILLRLRTLRQEYSLRGDLSGNWLELWLILARCWYFGLGLALLVEVEVAPERSEAGWFNLFDSFSVVN